MKWTKHQVITPLRDDDDEDHEEVDRKKKVRLGIIESEMDWAQEMEVSFPEFEDGDQRLASFRDSLLPFPDEKKNLDEQLAKAAFFYLGFEDWVVCYHCAMCLKNVNENEPPLKMHARFFPDCPALNDFGGCYIDITEYLDYEDRMKLTTARITKEDKNRAKEDEEYNKKIDEVRKRFFEEKQCDCCVNSKNQ